MPLETGTFISDLVATNPTGTDSKSEGDNHLRLIKSTVKATFPNITGAVTKTHTQLNNALDKTGDTMTGPLAQAAGTAALPSYTFSGDTNTGIYSPGADQVAVSIGGTQALAIDASRNVLVTGSGGLGYGVGSGGTVTQATNKSTAVTLNKPCGQIVMNNAALPNGATVQFTLNNTYVSRSETVVIASIDGFSISSLDYELQVKNGPGAAYFAIKNVSGSSQSDAVVINFAILRMAVA